MTDRVSFDVQSGGGVWQTGGPGLSFQSRLLWVMKTRLPWDRSAPFSATELVDMIKAGVTFTGDPSPAASQPWYVISRSYLSDLVNGNSTNPGLDVLRAFSEFFQINAGFFAGDGDTYVEKSAYLADPPAVIQPGQDGADVRSMPRGRESRGHSAVSLEISEFFKQLRHTASRVMVLGAQAGEGRATGVTQVEVAAALRAAGHPVSLGRWQKLERGNASVRWSAALVAAVAALFQLPAAENLILHSLTLGHEPRELQAVEDASSANQLHLDSSTDPGYVEDDEWMLRAFNRAMVTCFPFVQEPRFNIMIFTMRDPRAPDVMVDWEGIWVPRMLAQLRTALYLAQTNNPELHRRLAAVVSECVKSPIIKRMWKEDAAYQLGAMGDVRRLMVGKEVVTMRLWAGEPLRQTGWRLIGLHPIR